MDRRLTRCAALALIPLLAACVSMPSGPSQMALPGTGKSFDQFRADDYECQQFASNRVGGKTPNEAAADSGVASAVIGAAVGAAAGAAINGGQGAAVGAGVGGATGALVGTGTASASSYELQRRYDAAYLQCMYAKGNKVPVYGAFVHQNEAPAAQPRYYPPPPPPGWRSQ
jgi:hypothetical protein